MTENTMSFYHAHGAPENPDTDYIVRATAYGGQVRALAIRSTVLCNRALEIHGTSPVATAALGGWKPLGGGVQRWSTRSRVVRNAR